MNEDLVVLGTAAAFCVLNGVAMWWSGYVIAGVPKKERGSMMSTVAYLMSAIFMIAFGMVVAHYWDIFAQRSTNTPPC